MSLPKTADIIVIGGGIIGTSVAYHIARRGAEVILLERNQFFGEESTAKAAGGVRAHFGTEINVRLSQISLLGFERLEAETGYSSSLIRSGYLFVLTRETDVRAFKAKLPMWERLGVRTEWWNGEEVRERFSIMRWDDALAAVWGPDDGLADPGSAVQGYVSAGSRAGARFFANAEVTAIRTVGGRIESVTTSAGEIALIGPVAGADGLYVVAGFSGHGFMHGPAAALIAAEEIVDGKATSLDPTPFRPDRFARGAAIQEDIVI